MRHLLHHLVRDVHNPEVLIGRRYVEDLVVDELIRGGQDGGVRPSDVFHVEERSPGPAGGLHLDPSVAHSPRHEVIDDQIQAKPRRHTVGRRVAQENRGERVIPQPRQATLTLKL